MYVLIVIYADDFLVWTSRSEDAAMKKFERTHEGLKKAGFLYGPSGKLLRANVALDLGKNFKEE